MEQPKEKPISRAVTQEERDRLVLEIIGKMQANYVPGLDLVITPQNVYQEARRKGRAELEAFMDRLLLPGSRVDGLDHAEQCLADLRAGRHVLFLPEHRGNFDVPSFNNLLRREGAAYEEILDRLIYIAGRKLNESSETIKMFTEKYSRLVIVPRRDFPKEKPAETGEETRERKEFEKYAARINFAAFRLLIQLKNAGHIFVLYPLGGRLKPDADTLPVRETASYLARFDRAYPISMEGNTLPPEERMEDERPLPDKVIFRFGPPLDCKAFLAGEKARYKAQLSAGRLSGDMDYEQFTVNRIMEMLENLRLKGNYGNPA